MKAGPRNAMKMLQLVFLPLLFLTPGYGQAPVPVLINHLQGTWEMTGVVRNKPVRYIAEGVFILKDQFLSFHMKDAAVPSTYEANLFIGFDSSRNQYIAHWLDSFGGAGARVVGVGPFSYEKIEVIYPYAEGKFRNLFRYDPRKDQWTLVIESEDKSGTWALFAQYDIVRRK